ncbi:MAG: restriction endonuclease subunit S [Lachnospiraceae bacterium]|nr:restriction endonuclease subunit S [Lachnospiraceae bacterium]
MREMKDSKIAWIGSIPKNWNIYRNKNAFTCSKEIVGDRSSTTQLLSLTTKGVKEKDINNAEGKLPETFDTYQIVKTNNLIMCLFDLDVSAVFSGISSFDGMISPAYKVLSCRKDVYPQYADYWFKYIGHGRKFNHYAKNIRYTLNIDEFQSLPMLFPPLEEQKRIAEYLDSKCSKIDEIISKQEQIIEKLKEYKLSVITEAVTKGLDPNVEMKDSGVEWIGQCPEKWILSKAKYYVVITNGSDPQTEGDIPVYGSGEKSFKTCGEFKEGPSVLIGRKGATLHIPHYIEGSYWNVDTAFDVKAKDGMVLKYYYYLATCFDYKQYISQTTLPGMTQTNYNNMIIPVPDVQEQNKIVNWLNLKIRQIDNLIERITYLTDRKKEYKKSLIYEVVTGKKEV